MRVLFLNQCFHPDVVATAQMGWDLAQALRDRGHQVTAVASRSIYGTKGCSLPRREWVQGIRIERVGISLFGKSSIIARAIDFGFFYLLALIRIMRLPRQDVVICFTTPPMISMLGVVLKLLRGTRLICWTMDLYPEVLAAGGLMRSGSIGYRLLRLIDTFGLRSSDRIVCLGRCMRERIVARGVDQKRISVVHVWGQELVGPTMPRRDNRFRQLWGLQDRFVVMYSGNLGLGHDITTMEHAIEELASDDAVQWVIVGGGKGREALQRRLLARPDAMRRVEFHPYQRIEELQELLQTADVHIASMLPGWEGLIVPSKCIGVMAVGRPLLWIGPGESECARMILDAGCGMRIEPGDSRTLVKVIHELRSDPRMVGALGAAGERAAKGSLSRREACEQWIEIVELLGPKTSDPTSDPTMEIPH